MSEEMSLFDERNSQDGPSRIVARLLLDLDGRSGFDLDVDDETLRGWFDDWKKIVKEAGDE